MNFVNGGGRAESEGSENTAGLRLLHSTLKSGMASSGLRVYYHA